MNTMNGTYALKCFEAKRKKVKKRAVDVFGINAQFVPPVMQGIRL